MNLDNQGHVLLASGKRRSTDDAPQPWGRTTWDWICPRLGRDMHAAAHAISQSGETVFFTATPNPVSADEQTLEVYARVPCGFAASHVTKKADGGKER